MSAKLQFSKPPPGIFSFLPIFDPETIPPQGPTPFNIPTEVYKNLLNFQVPVAVATLYIFTVCALNSYNQRNGNKPWAISKSNFFFIFVVLHNIALALYSGWTFIGMWGTLKRSIPSPNDSDSLVKIVDSLCKIHGPPGLGNSILYNATITQWVSQSTPFTSDGTEILKLQSFGRIWNEGLAFYGWIFYLSKFYEVLDTLIILAKGKLSGTLQTYHHTGAMLCMWAGIRFMSPPIWMFVFVNSAIHTLMYTYYTLTAFNIRVPRILKQSLTTAQIMQFLVGASYAAIHSFISYSYQYEFPIVKTVLNEPASTTLSSIRSVVTSISLPERIKDLFVISLGRSSKVQPEVKLPKFTELYTFYNEKITSNCLDTIGQNFAVWLNVIYLTPLTYLFMQFFINSYMGRSSKTSVKVQAEADNSFTSKRKN
ncbi:putative fatty acid elongase [Erysiphe neolycopersici]|uniref:Elongation of fatty acids protein n=1 Tax=Erysiphe neolycopersici TaxID=212602 RepID=A0A420HHU5_9PEZI|nr:putative fatty acid elongase [Erysiphe neolycopersici]